MNKMVPIYEKGVEENPFSKIIIANLIMLITIIISALPFWFFNKYLSILYFMIMIFICYVLLRKLVCTKCYYYDKKCSIGWGKLSAKMFKKGEIEKFNEGVGIIFAPIFYGFFLLIIPLIILLISLIINYNHVKIIILFLLIIMSIYSGFFGRKKSCEKCKMRFYCKGSAAPKKKS